MTPIERKMTLLMLMGTVFWAGAFITGKMGVYLLSPIVLTFLRMAIATLIIFPFMVLKEKKNWKIERTSVKYALATALVGMTGYHLFFFYALKYTDASKAAMINAVNPLMTAVLATWFVGEKLSPRKIFFILTALLGVILTLTNWNIQDIIHFNLNKGDLLMLVGAFLWASYSVIVRKVMPYFTPLKLTSYTFLFASVITLPFAILEISKLDFVAIGWMPFLAVLYMAIFPSVIGYTIQQTAIKELGAGKAALFINLVPVFSTLFAVAFLGETLYKLNLVSGGLIIGSVILFNRQKT
ncbi:MAG: DMT family transporter [Tissierellales bacterium]|nr:DMT family transporter [Tissierellales bacterium]MBN2827797.1 DMT family transporter [Tissierellales bacterium]